MGVWAVPWCLYQVFHTNDFWFQLFLTYSQFMRPRSCPEPVGTAIGLIYESCKCVIGWWMGVWAVPWCLYQVSHTNDFGFQLFLTYSQSMRPRSGPEPVCTSVGLVQSVLVHKRLVRVSEGDGLVSELCHAPIKSLTPQWLWISALPYILTVHEAQIWPWTQSSQLGLVQMQYESCKGDGWVSELCHAPINIKSLAPQWLWISTLPYILTVHEAQIWPWTQASQLGCNPLVSCSKFYPVFYSLIIYNLLFFSHSHPNMAVNSTRYKHLIMVTLLASNWVVE